jgi:hypothetical protein
MHSDESDLDHGNFEQEVSLVPETEVEVEPGEVEG